MARTRTRKIIGDHTVQAYFPRLQEDRRRTISHLRFEDAIRSLHQQDFVACHNPSYVPEEDVKPGGVYMINCQWDFKLNHPWMPSKRYIAQQHPALHDKKIEIGMGKRNNTILQSAFFSLAKVMPEEDAIRYMKEKAKASYLKKGQDAGHELQGH